MFSTLGRNPHFLLNSHPTTHNNTPSQYDDDEVKAAFGEINGAWVGVVIGFTVTGIIANAVAIYGAAAYNNIFVAIGAVWYVSVGAANASSALDDTCISMSVSHTDTRFHNFLSLFFF